MESQKRLEINIKDQEMIHIKNAQIDDLEN
jgi:hypothetical protein